MAARLVAFLIGISLLEPMGLAQDTDAAASESAQKDAPAAEAPAETPSDGEAPSQPGASEAGKPSEPEATGPSETPATSAPARPSVVPMTSPPRISRRSRQDIIDRWENGFDVKLTGLFSRSAGNLTSPTLMLSAQWNYRFPTDTYLGLTVSGTPQANTDMTDTGTKRSFSTYYGGLNLAQGLLDYGGFRIVGTVSGGKGLVFVRQTLADGSKAIGSTQYNFVEAGGFVTFFNWRGVDFGVVGAYRAAKVAADERATDADLTSVSYGLTFRTRGW